MTTITRSTSVSVARRLGTELTRSIEHRLAIDPKCFDESNDFYGDPGDAPEWSMPDAPIAVPLTLSHLQEIVRECTTELEFARESEDFEFLRGVVTAWMHIDRLANGSDAHVWHLDDYCVALDQSGLVVTTRPDVVD